MSIKLNIPIWKTAPFVRLLLALIIGIMVQFYLPIPLSLISIFTISVILGLVSFSFTTIGFQFRYGVIRGLLVQFLVLCLGLLLTYNSNLKSNNNWYGNIAAKNNVLVCRIAEPLVAKQNSFKTTAHINFLIDSNNSKPCIGKVLLYFAKADSVTYPKYGDEILIQNNLQLIKNKGNPGGFDYAKYMSFQQIYNQQYLKPTQFKIIDTTSADGFYNFIFSCRQKVIDIIQTNISGSKKVTGIIEALLIGYKEDLDKDVVQAYSNTGVVHIIAISGMHLGLIYVVLVWLFARLPLIKRYKLLQVIFILSSLWLFSLITGGSASVLRSAVMFTCIVIGKNFFKQASIYNALATSAFFLLCYNPYLLWDVGFQLSYTAVLGIVSLQKPIESLWYSKYWFFKKVWKMIAITLAAQVFTLPLCIFYFHQIPVLFLFTNLICVPLSTAILFGIIGVIITSGYAPLSMLLGKIFYGLTWCMNYIIDFFNSLSFAVVDDIFANHITTLLLYIFAILLSASLLKKNKAYLKYSLITLLLFTTGWAYGKIKSTTSKQIIIYNVSKHTAIDFMSNNKFWFYGDEDFKTDGTLQNFNLKPSRIQNQVTAATDTLPNLFLKENIFNFYGKTLWWINKDTKLEPNASLQKIDVILISKNVNIDFANLAAVVKAGIIVFDGSNSLWKINKWKEACTELNLHFHSTAENGAYVLNVLK
jgi:competence protein ComEC